MTGYVGFGNDILANLPLAKKGMMIECLKCGKDHPLECGKKNGKESNEIMFYKCGDKIYLGAVAGRVVNNVKPCCSGNL